MHRSPVSANRKIDDTSFDDGDEGAKAQKLELEPPAWASKLLLSMERMEANQQTTNSKLDEIGGRVTELEVRVEAGAQGQMRLEDEVALLKLENAALRGTVKGLRVDLDKQTDSDLRDHIVFYGVPGNEKTWEETAQRLAKWLGENIPGKTVEKYDDNIWRAHRGPLNPEKNGPRPIFCKMNYRYAEHIKDKLKFGKLNTGVTFREQYCPNTQARVNEALVYRKDWKARNRGGFRIYKFSCSSQSERSRRYRLQGGEIILDYVMTNVYLYF